MTCAPAPRGLALSALSTLRRECTCPAASMKLKSRARNFLAAAASPLRIAACSARAAPRTDCLALRLPPAARCEVAAADLAFEVAVLARCGALAFLVGDFGKALSL